LLLLATPPIKFFRQQGKRKNGEEKKNIFGGKKVYGEKFPHRGKRVNSKILLTVFETTKKNVGISPFHDGFKVLNFQLLRRANFRTVG
jgi:hypothetical protein